MTTADHMDERRDVANERGTVLRFERRMSGTLQRFAPCRAGPRPARPGDLKVRTA
jgi:hypothetical protein